MEDLEILTVSLCVKIAMFATNRIYGEDKWLGRLQRS